jgi:transcriptional regulator with XRE-family HTH domain
MSPVNVPAIGAYIREQREQAKISLRQLAQATGVSNPYLSQIERGLRKPSADILQQLAKGLRISAEALYVQAGFLEDKPEGYGVREAVLAAPDLTERQKQMLLEIYDSFRNEPALDAEEALDGPGAAVGDAGLDPAAQTWPELAEGHTAAVPARPVVGQPVVDQPVIEQPVIEQPVIEQEAVEQAGLEEAALERVVAEQAAAEQEAAEQAAAERETQEPAAKQARPKRAASKAAPRTQAGRRVTTRAGGQRAAPRRATSRAAGERVAKARAAPKAASERAGSKAAGPEQASNRQPTADAPEAARPAEPRSGSSSGNRGRAGRARPSTARTR